MTSSNARPKWWQLYLTFPLLIALFVLDHRLKISTLGHEAVQIGIILIVYGLIHVWLKANARALSRTDQQQYHGTFKVIQIPPYQVSTIGDDKRPMLQFPNSEIKGVLDDTYQTDYIDAESFPVDKVSQELDKE